MNFRLAAISLGALLGLLAACAVGPNYKAPPAPQTAGYAPPGALPGATVTAPIQDGGTQRFVDAMDIPGQWWTLFQSPQLNELIARALANNPTLDAAQAALRQANENLAAQRGSYFPSITGQYQAERQKSSGAAFGLPQAGSALYTLNSASVNVSYTLDVFGGVRRAVEGLQAAAESQQFALEATYLSLTANIVTAAISEASLRAQLVSTQDIASSQQRQLDITQHRFDAGGAARADVLLQQSTLQTTLASLPTLRAQLAQERNLLATYVGSLPADYHGFEIDLNALTLPAELPVSLPSQLVEQRPDVRQYAATLHQATAQIGVATAAMLPQFTVTGAYGGDALKFANIISPGSVIYSLTGSVAQSLFKGGQLLHQRRAAIAAAQQAAANYRNTVIMAFENVSNSLYALDADAEVLAANAIAERTAASSLKLMLVQYKSGSASYVQVLTAEQTYQNAAIALVKARAQRYADTAALFQSLGGGWWNRTDVAANQ